MSIGILKKAFYYASEHCGFKPDDQRTEGTYGKYSSIDDKIDGLHYFTHFIKFGLGRCTLMRVMRLEMDT